MGRYYHRWRRFILPPSLFRRNFFPALHFFNAILAIGGEREKHERGADRSTRTGVLELAAIVSVHARW